VGSQMLLPVAMRVARSLLSDQQESPAWARGLPAS
jgi:hypothetical protein